MHKLAYCAGGLVMLALATPYLGALVAPHAQNLSQKVRIIDSAVSAPVFTAAPVARPPPPEPDAGPPVSDAVYGDPKTSDFDPEHPPGRMGEPG